MNIQIFNEDCIDGMSRRIEAGSIDLTVTSIPFEELFTYSGKLEDVGNNGSTIDVKAGRFALNMRFVIEALLRVHRPGTNACIHIQQLLAYRNQHGFSGRRDFRGAVIDLFRAGGWHFHGEAAIPKDPQVMAQKLSLHSLQFKTGHSRSSTDWAMAPNDYVLIFQKPGDAEHDVRPLIYKPNGPKPIKRADFYAKLDKPDPMRYAEYLRGWAREVGAINPTGWLSSDDWIRWASGVWDDIDQFDVLDGARYAKENDQEKHVCPLQLEVIRRCVMLYSNPISIQPDSTVLDPFDGIGSTAWICCELNRNHVGFELKESYHAAAQANVARALAAAETTEANRPTLFDRAGKKKARSRAGARADATAAELAEAAR